MARTKVSKKEAQNKSGKTKWRPRIISWLKDNQGATLAQLVKNTHPSGKDITKDDDLAKKMQHNFASQKTYLKDEGYLVVVEDEQIFMVTEPDPKDKDSCYIIEGQEDRYNRLG